MIRTDPSDTDGRRARIEQMIDEYREAKQRRLVERAKELWCEAEFDQSLAALEAGPQSIH